MKRYIIYFTVIISLNIFSQNNVSGVITYGIKNNSEIKSDTIKDSSLKKVMKSLFSNAEKTEHLLFKLKFNGTRAVFSKDNTLSANEKSRINPIELELSTRGKIFSELSKDLNLTKLNSDKILISDSLNFKWKLSKETKTIAGYVCYKATGIRKLFKRRINTYVEKPVIAWYTPKINIPSGPSGYGKLPGVILELTEVGLLTFVVKQIKLNSVFKLEEVPKYKIYSRYEYDQILRKQRSGN